MDKPNKLQRLNNKIFMNLIDNLKIIDELLRRLFAFLATGILSLTCVTLMLGGSMIIFYVFILLFNLMDFRVFDLIKISLLSACSWYLGFSFYQILQKIDINHDDFIRLP